MFIERLNVSRVLGRGLAESASSSGIGYYQDYYLPFFYGDVVTHRAQMYQDIKASPKQVIRALGLVFGDIGTSPIYTFAVVLLAVRPTPQAVLGIISLIIWTLFLIVSLQYAWLAMGLADEGEGGPVVLRERLAHCFPPARRRGLVQTLLFLQLSLLIGDSVITPAMSILSAVEGLRLLPDLADMPNMLFVGVASIVCLFLFWAQSRGADRIGGLFGPIMLVWFIALAALGIYFISDWHFALEAFNPWYGLRFIAENRLAGILILNRVLLCATGGEALFSDIGHVGRRPIQVAWIFVLICLLLNYLGQAQFLLDHQSENSVLFQLAQTASEALFIPFLILTTVATVIASQSVISSVASIIYQAINIRVFPPLRIIFTSVHLRTQVYLPIVNWTLFVAVQLLLWSLQTSDALANAYGLAVICTMSITGVFLTLIFMLQRAWLKFGVAALLLAVDCTFLFASLEKIPEGGYWSLIIASTAFMIMFIYDRGRKVSSSQLANTPLAKFLPLFQSAYQSQQKLPGLAVFAAADLTSIQSYVMQSMFQNKILYEENLFVKVFHNSAPYGISVSFPEASTEGLRFMQVEAGYRQIVNLNEIFESYQINPVAIFYGREEVSSHNPLWKIYGFLRRICPSWVQYYRADLALAHGVVTTVKL